MPGQVPPPAESYEVRSEVIDVDDADCGLNSHDTPSLQAFIDQLRHHDERGWEALNAHRSVWVTELDETDQHGLPKRARRVRHELALRVSPPRKHFDYKIDALSDPVDPHTEAILSTRIREGWELIGCSSFDFRAVTTSLDGHPIEHHTKDAVLVFKRPQRRGRR